MAFETSLLENTVNTLPVVDELPPAIGHVVADLGNLAAGGGEIPESDNKGAAFSSSI
jgi:hypothetical protein